MKAKSYRGWLRYKDRATPAVPALSSHPQPDKHVCDERSDGDETFEEFDQLAQFFAEPVHCETSSKDSPIRYSLGQASSRPQLTPMAVDIHTLPAMSSGPERLFSTAGDFLSQRRRRLKSEITKYLVCLQSWQKHGLIQLDRSLFKRAVLAITSSET